MSKKQKYILTNFGDKYEILEWDGGFLLYDTTQSDGTRYVFNDDYYDSIDSLVNAMGDYNATLPFDAELYNPVFRKNYKVECILNDYLVSLGFKRDPFSGKYNLLDAYGQPICVIVYEVKDDTEDGSVSRLIANTDKWVDAEFHNIESAIGACNSLIVSQCAYVNAQLVGVLSKLTNSRAAFIDKTFDIKSLSVFAEDAKEKTIKQLEEELKRLKEL